MFIAASLSNGSRSVRSEISRFCSHCAPPERSSLKIVESYKHAAPPEQTGLPVRRCLG